MDDYDWDVLSDAYDKAKAELATLARRVIAAEKLVEALEIVADGNSKDYTDNYLMAEAALAAYREASK